MEKIILVKHDEKWVREFREEKNILSDMFEDLFTNMHHVGSTAVADYNGKGIDDAQYSFSKTALLKNNFNTKFITFYNSNIKYNNI